MVAFPDSYAPTISDRVYHPSGAGTSVQKYNLFYPTGRRPRRGWPVLVHFNGDAFSSSSRLSEITSANGLPYLALTHGIAVASASMTYTNALNSSGAIVSGRGTWKPWTDTAFSGPIIDAGVTYAYGQDIPEKDGCWVLQNLRINCEEDGTDITQMVAYGDTYMGSAVALFATYFPEGCGYQGFYTAGSSKANGCIARAPIGWWPAFTNGSAGNHFPASADSSPYNAAAATLISGAASSFKQTASLLYYAFDLTATPEVQRDAAKLPCHLHASLPTAGVESTTFDQTSGATYDTTYAVALNTNFITNTISNLSSAWGAYTIKKQLSEIGMVFQPSGRGSRLTVSSNVATIGSGITYDRAIGSADMSAAGDLALDQLAWLQTTLEVLS